jgi:hypothetical protein
MQKAAFLEIHLSREREERSVVSGKPRGRLELSLITLTRTPLRVMYFFLPKIKNEQPSFFLYGS